MKVPLSLWIFWMLLGTCAPGCSYTSSTVQGTALYDPVEMPPVGPRAVGPVVDRGRFALQGSLQSGTSREPGEAKKVALGGAATAKWQFSLRTWP